MPVKGDHLEPARTNTTDFSKYNIMFENKLVAMYEITYTEVVARSHTSGRWKDDAYFHRLLWLFETRILDADNEKTPSHIHVWRGN